MAATHNAADLECPVCLERLSDPKILPCGHTFCSTCIKRICKRFCESSGRLQCPVCREAFRLHEARPNSALQSLREDYSTSGRESIILPHYDLARDITAQQQSHTARCKQLEHLGLPPRLAATVAEDDCRIGARIFLLDNSESTVENDGKRLQKNSDGTTTFLPCTRWEEIKQLALTHAEWNSRLGTPCEFVLLNPQSRSVTQEGVDYMRVTPDQATARPQLEQLRKMLNANGPRGTTPLAARVREIANRITSQVDALASANQSVMLIIATDGVPTESRRDFMNALRVLMATQLAQVVIRLCTDDDEVVDFYNEIEQEFELPLDVLDDCQGEAKELAQQGNGWFVYTPELHCLREGGTFVKILDVLDERRLTAVEAALLAQLLLCDREEPPLPANPATFLRSLEDLVAAAAPTYCVRRRRMVQPIDIFDFGVTVQGFWPTITHHLVKSLHLGDVGCLPKSIKENELVVGRNTCGRYCKFRK